MAALLYAANNSAFPVRMVVASRPERAIQSFVAAHAKGVTREIFLDARYDSDIRLFLNEGRGDEDEDVDETSSLSRRAGERVGASREERERMGVGEHRGEPPPSACQPPYRP